MIQWGRFVGKGWVVQRVGVKCAGVGGRVELVVGEGGGVCDLVQGVGEGSEGARVWTHSATSVTEEV